MFDGMVSRGRLCLFAARTGRAERVVLLRRGWSSVVFASFFATRTGPYGKRVCARCARVFEVQELAEAFRLFDAGRDPRRSFLVPVCALGFSWFVSRVTQLSSFLVFFAAFVEAARAC